MSAEHRYLAQTLRTHIRFLQDHLADLDARPIAGVQPYEAAMILLMTMPGIDRLAAARLLVEIGEDMSPFGSAGRLAKRCGVCPGNDESAGKRRSGKTTQANRYVRTLLCEIALAAARTTSQFKSRFQDLVARRGTKRAIVAIAHRVVRTVCVLLSRRVPYRDSTVDYEALAVKRKAPRWIRQLKKYGLLPTPA